MFKHEHHSRKFKENDGYASIAELKKLSGSLGNFHALVFFVWPWSLLSLAHFLLLFRYRFFDCPCTSFLGKGFVPSFHHKLPLISYAPYVKKSLGKYINTYLSSKTIFLYPAVASVLLASLPCPVHLAALGLIDLCSPCSPHVLSPAPIDILHFLVHLADHLAMTPIFSALASTFLSTLLVPFCACSQGNHMTLKTFRPKTPQLWLRTVDPVVPFQQDQFILFWRKLALQFWGLQPLFVFSSPVS